MEPDPKTVATSLNKKQVQGLAYIAGEVMFDNPSDEVVGHLMNLKLMDGEPYDHCPVCAHSPGDFPTLTDLGTAVLSIAFPSVQPTIPERRWWLKGDEGPDFNCLCCNKREWQSMGSSWWCGNCGTLQWIQDDSLRVIVPEAAAEAYGIVERMKEAKAQLHPKSDAKKTNESASPAKDGE